MDTSRPIVLPTSHDERVTIYDPSRLGFASLHNDKARRARRLAAAGHDGTELSPAETAEWEELTTLLSSQEMPEPVSEQNAHINQLVVGNTYHCNMGCSYCYNELDLKDKKGSEVPQGMTWDIAKASIDSLIAQAVPGIPLSLMFIGGEPLLERQLLVDSVAYAKAECAKHGFGVKFTVYTNGTMMNRGVVDWAARNRVSMVISLDGPPTLNDAHRVYLSGAPTSKAVLRNLRRLVESDTQQILRIRAVSQVATPLVPLHRYLLDLGFNEIHVQPMYDENGITAADQGGMVELLEWWKNLLIDGTVISVMPFDAYFQKLLRRGKLLSSWYPCNAGRNAVTVGPDGRIYACHHAIEEPEYELGHISRGLPIAEVRQPYFRRVDQREPCRSCWARHVCGGECYHRSSSSGKGYYGTLPAVCRERKSMIGLALDALAQVAKANPDALRRLARMDLSKVTPNWAAYDARDLRDYL